MGNAVGTELAPPGIDDLLQNNYDSGEGSIFDEFNSILRIWVFSPSSKDPLCVINKPMSLATCEGFNPDYCYIILHSYRTEPLSVPSTQNVEKPFPIDVLDLALSAKTNLSPRGQKTCFAGFHSVANAYCQFFSGSTSKYDLYLWNGLDASQSIKANSLAKIFELDGALKDGDINHYHTKPEKYKFVPISSLLGFDAASLLSEDWTPLLQQNHLLGIVNESSPFFDDGYPVTPKTRGRQPSKEKNQIPTTTITIPPNERGKKKKKARRNPSKDRPNVDLPKLSLESQFPITKTSFHSISLPASKLEPLKLSMDFRLDFGQLHQNSDKDMEREGKAKKIARLNPICSFITESLYLGSDTAAQDYDQLKRCGVTHVLNCAATICKNYFPTEFTYKALYLYDGNREKIDCLFYNVLEFIDDAISSGGVVFIHCQQGISRSSAMLILYLMWKRNKPYTETHEFVKSQRAIVNPNAAFTTQLLVWWSNRKNPNPTTVYIVTQHRKEAAELPALRRIDPPGDCLPSFVDPRFCYIIFNHLREELFLWRGSQCDSFHKKEGVHYIKLLQRFENAPNSFKKENQGKESSQLVSCFPAVKTIKIDPTNDAYHELVPLLSGKKKDKRKKLRIPSLYK